MRACVCVCLFYIFRTLFVMEPRDHANEFPNSKYLVSEELLSVRTEFSPSDLLLLFLLAFMLIKLELFGPH